MSLDASSGRIIFSSPLKPYHGFCKVAPGTGLYYTKLPRPGHQNLFLTKTDILCPQKNLGLKHETFARCRCGLKPTAINGRPFVFTPASSNRTCSLAGLAHRLQAAVGKISPARVHQQLLGQFSPRLCTSLSLYDGGIRPPYIHRGRENTIIEMLPNIPLLRYLLTYSCPHRKMIKGTLRKNFEHYTGEKPI